MMTAPKPRRRRTWLLLTAAALRGTCSGVARAALAWLLGNF